MGVVIDGVSLTVKGNVAKKFDGTTTLLKFGPEQLDEVIEGAQAIKAMYGQNDTSFNQGPLTSDAAKTAS